MKLKLSVKSLKGSFLSKDELTKLKEIEALIPEYENLLKTKSKLTSKLKKLNQRINIIENYNSEFNLLLKKNNKHLSPVISIGFDKRWATYNCIVKISGTTKSFYLGKENAIKKKIQQFHSNNIMGRGINFIKSEVIKITSTVITQFIDMKNKENPFKKRTKLNLDNVLERYVASGEWDYWSSR